MNNTIAVKIIYTDMIALEKIAAASLFCLAVATAIAVAPPLLNEPVDISGDFHALENFYYLADQVRGFRSRDAQWKNYLPARADCAEARLRQ